MLQVTLETVGGKLAGDLVAGAAHAAALGVAALDHEAGDDPVEDKAVKEAFLYQRDKVVDGVGGHLRVKLGHHLAAAFHFKGHDGIAHVYQSFLGLAGPRGT